MHIALIGVGLRAEILIVLLCRITILEVERRVGSRYISACVTLGGMYPVDEVHRAILCDDDVIRTEITVQELEVLRHGLETGQQLIARACIDGVEAIDLVGQLIAQLLKQRSLLREHQHLKIDHLCDVLALLLWMLLHELLECLTGDILTLDHPLAILLVDSENLWYMEAFDGLYTCVCESFVKYF